MVMATSQRVLQNKWRLRVMPVNKVSFNGVTTLTNGAVFTLAIGPRTLRLTAKVVLQGAWNGTVMRTDLKTAGVLPATDPYGQNTTLP